MKCYLCKAKTTLFMVKNGYKIYLCPSCGLKQTDLHKSYNSFVSGYYSKGYFTGDPTLRAYDNYVEDKKYTVANLKPILAEIQKYKHGGTLLDVGCATGFFVELALKNNFDAYGFDPSEYAVLEARRLVGSRVKSGTISKVIYKPKFFDVITLFDVFEHLQDPLKDIERLSHFLKDDGIMIIATGNSDCLMAKIMGRKWTFYNPPQHLFFFNKTLMRTFLYTVHMKPIHWFTVGKWLNIKYVLHLARSVGESKIGSLLFSIVDNIGIHHFPVYLPVQDNMVVIAQKRL